MKRNKFSLSHYKIFSATMGPLIPIGLTEVLPGDTFQMSTSLLVRCAPLLSPVMHPVRVRVHHWFVPHRISWDDFESFITGGEDGMDDSVFPTITFPTGSIVPGTLADYFGLPLNPDGPLEVSALPFRAYCQIFGERYRDQDLVTYPGLSRDSGPDSITSTLLQQVSWEKDYFTSARPWPQKGPEVVLPIGDSAPVTVTPPAGGSRIPFITPGVAGYPNSADITFNNQTASELDLNAADLDYTRIQTFGTSPNQGSHWKVDGTAVGLDSDTILGILHPNLLQGYNLSADLTQSEGVNITNFREAMALQRYQEARARYGARYCEYLRYLGIRSSDARLQEPEYLGGGQQTIQFSEVLQTAEGTSPVGEMRGHGIAAVRSNRFRRFFEEHGYIISLLSVRPRTMYSQGIPRTWNRRTKEDFFQKELQHIGQQEILNKELYAASPVPDGTFGYQDRYDEYRRCESTIAGEFRDVLDFWHFGRTFDTAPALNSSFVQSVPTTRTFAVPSEDTLYVMASHNIKARRMLSRSGVSFIK